MPLITHCSLFHYTDRSFSSTKTSEKWFSALSGLNSALAFRPRTETTSGFYRPVKIAVLDTGLKAEARDIIKGYKNFTGSNSDDDDLLDDTGHGTFAVRLLERVNKDAELYVGRVFESSQATGQTAIRMAKAIHHATDEWKVDIIVMPSGFASWQHDELESAIDAACAAKVLMFTAASNHGNFGRIPFPGCLYVSLKLFCMFSTDHNVRASHFNPSASQEAKNSFAILGEHISLHGQKSQSGTSWATVIGAAVTSRILDFSRQDGIRGMIQMAHKLRTVEGMSAVFKKMAGGAVDNGLYCISPWKLLPPEVEGEDAKERRSRARRHICDEISAAVTQMYG